MSFWLLSRRNGRRCSLSTTPICFRLRRKDFILRRNESRSRRNYQGLDCAESDRLNMSPKQKSLILITVDCLRADHCGFYGYSRPTTPFLDALAAESFVVPTAVVAGAPTYYSLPAILASRMPLALGRDVIGLASGESTLATALREAGYATAAFSAANPYISARFGYDQGFEVFEDFLDFEPVGSRCAIGRSRRRGTPRVSPAPETSSIDHCSGPRRRSGWGRFTTNCTFNIAFALLPRKLRAWIPYGGFLPAKRLLIALFRG